MHSQLPNTSVPKAYTVDGFLENVPIGKTSLYKLLKDGRIKSTIICGRRLIPATEADRLLSDGIALNSVIESEIKSN